METIWLHGKDNDKASGGSNMNRRPCKFWRIDGSCRRGSECEFSHDGPPGSPPRIKNDTICKFWAERGHCAKGSACNFSHNFAPAHRDPLVCKFWMQGRCQKGMSCGFRHPVLRPDHPAMDGPPVLKHFERPRGRFDMEPSRRSLGGRTRGFDGYGPRRRESRERRPVRGSPTFLEDKPRNAKMQTLCKFFLKGDCERGAKCEFSHQTKPNPEKCKFWGTAPCFKGEYCPYTHIGPSIEEKQNIPRRESAKRKRSSERIDKPYKKRMKKETRDIISLVDQDDVMDFGNYPAATVSYKPSVEIGTRNIQNEEKLDAVLENLNMKSCLKVAIRACRSCGSRICDEKDYVEGYVEKLSELEEECNNILATAIAGKYPLHAIVGKQNVNGHTAITSAPTWFIASIDGIDNLIRGSSSVCVSIGLCVERRPVLGVIYNPLLDQLVAAYRGGGVFLNESDDPVEIENSRAKERAVIVSELFKGEGKSSMGRGIANMLEISSFSGFRASGSFNQNFLDVLQGTCDGGFQERAEGPWSICAGVTVIEEAGGVVTDLKGNLFELTMDKQEVVYGPKQLVQEMLRYF